MIQNYSGKKRGRITLALYNSYDKVRFAEAHRRALARAAPVAFAFDCNLCTIGFPFSKELKQPAEVSNWLSTTTSIGENGMYLTELADAGRFNTFDMPDRGFPPQLGTIIATTRRPDDKKKMTVQEAADIVQKGKSLTLLFGLGPHGLPDGVRDIAKYHLDVTGKGITFETATAIGTVPAVIWAIMNIEK